MPPLAVTCVLLVMVNVSTFAPPASVIFVPLVTLKIFAPSPAVIAIPVLVEISNVSSFAPPSTSNLPPPVMLVKLNLSAPPLPLIETLPLEIVKPSAEIVSALALPRIVVFVSLSKISAALAKSNS